MGEAVQSVTTGEALAALLYNSERAYGMAIPGHWIKPHKHRGGTSEGRQGGRKKSKNISKHIKILERADLLVRDKQGREIYLRLNPKPLSQIQDWLRFHEKFWTEKLTNLDLMIKKNHA